MMRVAQVSCSNARRPADWPATRVDLPRSHTHNPAMSRRKALLSAAGAGAMFFSGGRAAYAEEAESPVDALIGTLEKTEEDIRFEGTELVKTLLQRSGENKDRYKKELAEKYCFRQAEDGVGDCSGLRLIPGATKSGKQKAPGWLQNLLGGGQSEEKND